jgi:hypothetical protein
MDCRCHFQSLKFIRINLMSTVKYCYIPIYHVTRPRTPPTNVPSNRVMRLEFTKHQHSAKGLNLKIPT